MIGGAKKMIEWDDMELSEKLRVYDKGYERPAEFFLFLVGVTAVVYVPAPWLARLAGQITAKHGELAEHDQSDHVGIARLTKQLRELEDAVAELENRWLQLSEVVE